MKSPSFWKSLILFSILVFSISQSAFSQQNEAIKAKDEESLSRVCKQLASKKITKGDFRQLKFIHKLQREMASTGIYVISADDGILWKTEKPYFSVMTMTKTAIVQTNAKGKKNVLSAENNASFEQFSKVISSLFTSNADTLKENFEIEFIGNTDNWNINLIPVNTAVKSFVAEIDMAGQNSIDLMTIHETNGDYIRYEFVTHIYPESLTDEEKAYFHEK